MYFTYLLYQDLGLCFVCYSCIFNYMAVYRCSFSSYEFQRVSLSNHEGGDVIFFVAGRHALCMGWLGCMCIFLVYFTDDTSI